MKRYRIFQFDFDSRAMLLSQKIGKDWSPQAKLLHKKNKKDIELGLISQYGASNSDVKKQNFIDLGQKPVSVLAFHNKFFAQIRTSFVVGSYYPALTGCCALGERILNHLILTLRKYYKATPEYKKVYRKNSFDNWELAIKTLESWTILTEKSAEEFRKLEKMRHDAIHFKPDTDKNDRALALNAIHCLQEIIKNQFSGFGTLPWMFIVPGESYIKKEWEEHPFIKEVYVPNCIYVGPQHKITNLSPVECNDTYEYPDKTISDKEFIKLRKP